MEKIAESLTEGPVMPALLPPTREELLEAENVRLRTQLIAVRKFGKELKRSTNPGRAAAGRQILEVVGK